MAEITFRADLNRGLTNEEIDANFANLNEGKTEKSANLADLSDASQARGNIDVYAKAEADSQAIAMAIALG